MSRRQERAVDFDDYFECVDGSVFVPIVLLGACLALALRHWTGRWYQRVRARVGDVPSRCGLNGSAVALRLLSACGLADVRVKGESPTNDYHPWKREVRLRSDTHDAASLSALATAAHEVGHAQQFAEKIWRCRLRFVVWPVCWALLALAPVSAVLCVSGVVPQSEMYAAATVVAICAVVVMLQVPISLPLESDATRRAKKLVTATGLLAEHEQVGFDRVLSASWMTHASADVQRWIVLTSIALATAGYLGFESYQRRLFEQMPAYDPMATADQLLEHTTALAHESPADSPLVAQPVDVNYVVYQPPGWGRLLWLIPLSPYVLVIGWIMMTLMGKSKPNAVRKLTPEARAIQRTHAANAQHVQGRHDTAIEEYTRAIELNPQLTAAWAGRGQSYFMTGHLEEALDDFDRAVRLAPHFLDAAAMRGHMRLLLGQEEDGLADLAAVVARDPANTAALVARAEYSHRCGDWDRAVADWTRAIATDSKRSDFYRNRGLLFYFRGDYQCAVEDQTEAIRLDPSDAIAWNNRGAALLKHGEWAKADADLREAIRLDPKLPNPYRHLAWLRATCPEAKYRNGNEAVAQAVHALQLTGGTQQPWLEVLAAAHAEAGNFDDAVRWQQQCLEHAPPAHRTEQQARLEMYQRGQSLRAASSFTICPAMASTGR